MEKLCSTILPDTVLRIVKGTDGNVDRKYIEKRLDLMRVPYTGDRLTAAIAYAASECSINPIC